MKLQIFFIKTPFLNPKAKKAQLYTFIDDVLTGYNLPAEW